MRGKEGIVRSLGAALLVGSFALGACSPSQGPEKDTPFVTPRASSEQKISQAEQNWKLLPIQDRLDRLFRKDNPKFPGFDAFEEMVKTTSEIFCQNATCYISRDDIPSHIKVLSSLP